MVISTTVTALLCGVWFLQLQVSHLNYGNSAQSRVCRRRKTESSSETSETVDGSSVSMWSGQGKGHGGTV